MYRHLMRLMSKSALLADSKGQMSTLSRADCMEKQDLSDPQKESKFILLARSTCYPCWKLPALHKACLHPPSFFFLTPLIPLSTSLLRSEVLAELHKAT